MLFKIEKDVWFDNEKIYVISGENNKEAYMKHYNELPDINYKKSENWKPTLIFLSSTRCNLRCRYCYAEHGTYGTDDRDNHFDLSRYISVFEYFRKAYGGIKAINFFGGEPMLNYSEIKKFVMYLHKNYNMNERPLLSIASNGTIMDKEKRDFLYEYGIHFGTSLDGTREYNDRNRIGEGIDSVFNIVSKTLDALADAGIVKIVQFTLTRDFVEGYKKGDIVKILSEFEKIPYSACELVPVESNDADIRIDLDDDDILKNYRMLCTDLAELYIDRLCTEGVSINRLSRLVVGLIVRIAKREYQEDCSAGKSVCISPKMDIFPCHTLASFPKFGVRFDKHFKLVHLEDNPNFAEAMHASRRKSADCDKCIAKQLCPFWCRGLSYCYIGDMHTALKARCELMKIFLIHTIRFMASDRYKENKGAVRRNVMKAHESLHLL